MADDRDYYGETIDRMEQNIAPVDHAAAIASIAVSMKRIADSLEALSGLAKSLSKEEHESD